MFYFIIYTDTGSMHGALRAVMRSNITVYRVLLYVFDLSYEYKRVFNLCYETFNRA